MDIVTYVLCKKLVASAASGISNIEVVGSDLVFTTSSGEQFTVTLPLPESSVSIVDIDIDENNNLLYTMSDGTIVNVGTLPSGEAGTITDEQIEEITQNVYNLLEEQYPNATEEDIDALFGPRSPEEYATKEDIDALFDEGQEG